MSYLKGYCKYKVLSVLKIPFSLGIAAMAVMRPEAIMKSIIPVVMAGIIAIYGVVVAVLIAGQLSSTGYTLYQV